MQKITLHKVGPIDDCQMDVQRFTVLTGSQASGKSTIAKAIFFFRTIAQDVIGQMQTRNLADAYRTTLENDLKKRLRNKFLQIFGSSWAMPQEMKLRYEYARWMTIELYLVPDRNAPYRNFVEFQFGEKIVDFLKKYDDYAEQTWDEQSWKDVQREINELFSDGYETIYVPAGRSLITLLTDQLVSILSSDEGRSLDFCMQAYVRRILSLRSQIRGGFSHLLDEVLHTTQIKVDRETLRYMERLMKKVLHVRYSYDRGEEQLFFDDHRYVKINFSSSGQQEAIWVFNILYFYLLQNQKVFLIVEEPEAHLYPDSQKGIAEAIGLFAGVGNQVFVTTHSPYILGQFNNMLYAGAIEKKAKDGDAEKLHDILNPLSYIKAAEAYAAYVCDGKVDSAVNEGLIRNELIDGASIEINDEMDRLLELGWAMEGEAQNA
jgi:putative uncharacterized protein GK3268